MDKLKPILAQKFWILLGVAVIMTMTGWWLATAAMVKEIKARSEEIEKAFKKVPTGKIPSDLWTTKLSDLNKSQEKSITLTRAGMWKGQLKKMMEWPEGVQPKNGYMGTFSNASKEEYREGVYVDEVTKVWKKLRPLETDGSGIVNYPIENMYALLRREPEWKGTIPDAEMWSIKEDLLLLESLFQSIAVVNGGPDVARTVEMIHQIDILELRGGSPTKGKPVAPTQLSATGAVGLGGAGGVDMPIFSADFNPVEEFGDDGSTSMARAAAQPVNDIRAGGRKSRMMDDEPLVKTPAAGAPAANKGKPVERYVTKVENSYRTRGFYLSVKMDHQKIPQLIAELTANDRSVFPVEIIRVQMSRLHEDIASSTTPAAGIPGQGNIRRNRGIDDTNFAMPGGQPGQGRALQPGTTEDGDQVLVAKASLDKALSNPAIAQVAICGIFTLYQEVKEEAIAGAPTAAPAAPAATPAATATPEKVTPPETKSDAETKADDLSSTTESNSESTNEPSEASAETSEEMTEAPAETDQPPDSNEGSVGNPDSAPAKKEDDEK